MMDRLTGAVGSVMGMVRKTARLGPSAEERRQAFFREFGRYPPHFEASRSERDQFGREVVRPVLGQRAEAVQQAAQGQGQQEAEAAFTRAYQSAVDLKLAEKGQTYQDYLGQRE